MKKLKGLVAASMFVLVLLVMGLAPGEAVLITGTSGSLSASANFTIVGGNLQVTLTNISANDVSIPGQVLTAVFFDIAGVGPLTPVSALLSGGSTVFFDAAPPGGIVGGEWAYSGSLAGAPGGATEGISSAGFGLFGGPNFPGADLDPPAAINGLNYGITSAGDNPLTGNAEVTGNVPLIHNSVVFTLSGLPAGFVLDGNLLHVSFQYGTALTETNLQVPEPATLLLLGSGLIGLAAWRRRIRQ